MVSVVVPVYNEEEVIMETHRRLAGVCRGLGEAYEIIYVNDGSRDRSAELLAGLCTDGTVRVVNFSRNFGHQNAITAGMDYASGDAVVVIDADLQDPPELIPMMLDKWREGYDVVYGRRVKRAGESVFKKITASAYYRLLRGMTNVDIPADTGDFRLIDRRVCEAMKALPERNRYVRGLVSWVGFRQTAIDYEREGRFAGETKYPLKKMIKLAVDGITAFSYKPLKLATGIGFLFSVCSFVYLLVVLFQRLFTDAAIQGWASTIAVLLFTQGIVLMILGIIGEYIGRIFDEIKGRPSYIVGETLGFPDDSGKDGR